MTDTTPDVTVHLTEDEYKEAVAKGFDRGVKVTLTLLSKVLDALHDLLAPEGDEDGEDGDDIEGAAV